MKNKITSLLTFCALTYASASYGEDLAWFEKRYEQKFPGVKSREEYGDPDAFYKAIAIELKIPDLAEKTASKKLGFQRNDTLLVNVKPNRGSSAFLKDDDGKAVTIWDVVITLFPKAPDQDKPDLKKMKMYYIEINDDLKVVSIHRIEQGPKGTTLTDIDK